MKVKIMCSLFGLCALTGIFAQGRSGYYIGDGGKGQNILFYKSEMEGAKNDELVTSMVKKSLISTLTKYSQLNVIDGAQLEIVKNLQQQSEDFEYDKSDPVEFGKISQARTYITATTSVISGKYRLSFLITDIETGGVTASYASPSLYETQEEYLMRSPREAGAEMLRQLGVDLTPSALRTLLPDDNGNSDAKKLLSDTQENLSAIKEEIDKLYEEQKKSLTEQFADQASRTKKARLELKEQLLLEQQKREEAKLARLSSDAERQKQEEAADRERTEALRAEIKRFGADVEAKVAAVHKKQAENMSALQKIMAIESEKQLLADNWNDIESGSRDAQAKLSAECLAEQAERKSQKPRTFELNPDGTLNEMASQLLENDLQRIREKFDGLQKNNKANENKLKALQNPLKKRIGTDISNLVKGSYAANTLANEGLFLRMGDYDASKLGWHYTLTFTMNDQTIFSEDGFFPYKDITGEEIPAIPDAHDKKYKTKVELYRAFLDKVESIDSFFRMNVPYVQAKIDYSAVDLSSIAPSVYGISVSGVQFINIQRGKVFKKGALQKENIFVCTPAITSEPVDEVVKGRLSRSKAEALGAWLEKPAVGETLKRHALVFGVSVPSGIRPSQSGAEKSLVLVPGGKIGKTRLDGFRISPTEVTQQLFESVTGYNPSRHVGALLPVENVGWVDAVLFCNRLSESVGLEPCYSVDGTTDTDEWGSGFPPDRVSCNFSATGYRLPTEAEWEYAARDSGDETGDIAWTDGTTHEVASKKSAESGIFDMLGNVAEWCNDGDGNGRVVKGGSSADKNACTVRSRRLVDGWPDERIGFRFVCRLSEKELAAERKEAKKKLYDAVSGMQGLADIPGGTFRMGNAAENAGSDEKPVHEVRVSDFAMYVSEITQNLYELLMDENPSATKGDMYPVENVSWIDAVKFCNKLSEATNRKCCYTINGSSDVGTWGDVADSSAVLCDWNADGYRLPTEAEWEYAARGGKKQLSGLYAGSGGIETTVWHSGNADTIQRVGGKAKNACGLNDMCGNVEEWCWDFYAESYDSGKDAAKAQKNPKGAERGRYRVTRGGSVYPERRGWGYSTPSAAKCTVYSRTAREPGFRGRGVGFRVVRAEK